MCKNRRVLYGALFCVLLLTEIGIALFVHDRFVRPYVGDMLVTVLLCSAFRVVVPRRVRLLPLFVLLFAAVVEAAQYIDIVALSGLQNNALVSTVIGRTFSISDILCYAVGCALFFAIERGIERYIER